jgi:hypothetical protein
MDPEIIAERIQINDKLVAIAGSSGAVRQSQKICKRKIERWKSLWPNLSLISHSATEHMMISLLSMIILSINTIRCDNIFL